MKYIDLYIICLYVKFTFYLKLQKQEIKIDHKNKSQKQKQHKQKEECLERRHSKPECFRRRSNVF